LRSASARRYSTSRLAFRERYADWVEVFVLIVLGRSCDR
jgi:hypothetical protein